MMSRLAPLLVLLFACTSSDFFVPPLVLEGAEDNRLALSGGFCAEGAQNLEAFLKIMFVVDRSNSMRRTDPNNRRLAALEEVVLQFIENPTTLELREGVQFALISFWGDVATHTRNELGLPGFTQDGGKVLSALAQIAQVSSLTGYDKALGTTFQVLDSDMARLDDAARARSRYEVFFVSDGSPDPCTSNSNDPPAAVNAVKSIVGLSPLYGVPVTFHTAFVSTPEMFTFELNDTTDPGGNKRCCLGVDRPPLSMVGDCDSDPINAGEVTRAVLREMAEAGGGTFKQFENGDSINFLDFEFAEARRLFALSYFMASNLNAVPALDHVLPDSDRDGLVDLDEALFGTSPYDRDTDGDGFSDAIEERLRLTGYDPLDPTDAQCEAAERVDTDGDGYLDCEERLSLLGTRRRAFDSDGDWLPDTVEILAQADANSATALADHQYDADADGATNAEELRWHTDPHLDDVARRARMAYDYVQSELPITTGQACYSFAVQNIRLASTVGAPANRTPDHVREQDGFNRVMLYFAQTPYDDPLAAPLYRVACVDARYIEDAPLVGESGARTLKMPATGHLGIPARRPSDTYTPTDVLRPNRTPCHLSNNQDCGLNTLWCRFNDDGTCAGCNQPPRIGDPPDGTPHPVFGSRCPRCSDGADNDLDGRTDYPFDADCFDSIDDDEADTTPCANGRDDDSDGKSDWPHDAGCASAYDLSESPDPVTECNDGLDNNNSGATDFPRDPGCDSAADPVEELNDAVRSCSDGLDNDGDGLADCVDPTWDGNCQTAVSCSPGGDPGCAHPCDVDEDGPAVCLFCELVTDARPDQCEMKEGHCRARSGAPPAGSCATDLDCRGGICEVATGLCSRCIEPADCDTSLGAQDGVCNSRGGFCLRPVPGSTPTACTTSAQCGGATCETDIGFCSLDPYYACRTTRDCAPEEYCSEERGFCLTKVFATRQCATDASCAAGRCDETLGWCLPDQGALQCQHNEECPLGDCKTGGYCDQQSFVFPEDFNADIDCLRGK